MALPAVWEHLEGNYVLGYPKLIVLNLTGVYGESDEIRAFIKVEKNSFPVCKITG